MVDLITPHTCSTCPHKVRDMAKMMCLRFPPHAYPIIVMTPKGPNVVGVSTHFPEVKPEWHCGEHPARKTSLTP